VLDLYDSLCRLSWMLRPHGDVWVLVNSKVFSVGGLRELPGLVEVVWELVTSPNKEISLEPPTGLVLARITCVRGFLLFLLCAELGSCVFRLLLQ